MNFHRVTLKVKVKSKCKFAVIHELIYVNIKVIHSRMLFKEDAKGRINSHKIGLKTELKTEFKIELELELKIEFNV